MRSINYSVQGCTTLLSIISDQSNNTVTNQSTISSYIGSCTITLTTLGSSFHTKAVLHLVIDYFVLTNSPTASPTKYNRAPVTWAGLLANIQKEQLLYTAEYLWITQVFDRVLLAILFAILLSIIVPRSNTDNNLRFSYTQSP